MQAEGRVMRRRERQCRKERRRNEEAGKVESSLKKKVASCERVKAV